MYKRVEVEREKLRKFPYDYTLVDQDGRTFPLERLKGKVLVVGYIYTNCPDICPFITDNMKKISKLVSNDPQLRERVMFVSITFDPKRDRPEVLRNYMKLYKIDPQNWVFLTGDTATISTLMDRLGIETIVQPKGETYIIAHTDRIHVVNERGEILAYFRGSDVVPDSVYAFLKRVI